MRGVAALVLAGAATRILDDGRRLPICTDPNGPNFIPNREAVDAIVPFGFLTHAEVTQIFDLELAKVEERLATKELKLQVTTEAKGCLIDNGFDDRTGARGIRRVLEERIEDPISEMIILGQINAGETAELDLEGDSLSMKILKAAATVGKYEA